MSEVPPDITPKQPESPPAGAQGAAPRAAEIERLFLEHNEALVRFLRPRLRSHQEALEVAQEAYVRLLSLGEPGAVSYLRAFLFKTAANLAVDRLRRNEVHDRATASPLFANLLDWRTPERRVAGKQAVQQLERLLAAMPEKRRRAFMLRRFEGLEIPQIARELGVSARRTREYIADALLECRALLDMEDPGND